MNNRVGIDFDGTILPFGPLVELDQKPYKGVPEAIRTLKEVGFSIIILTSRLSPFWWELDYARFGGKDALTFGIAQTQYVKDYLTKWEIPFDKITAEKIPCRVYFDDMFITVSKDYTLADAIAEYLDKTL